MAPTEAPGPTEEVAMDHVQDENEHSQPAHDAEEVDVHDAYSEWKENLDETFEAVHEQLSAHNTSSAPKDEDDHEHEKNEQQQQQQQQPAHDDGGDADVHDADESTRVRFQAAEAIVDFLQQVLDCTCAGPTKAVRLNSSCT